MEEEKGCVVARWNPLCIELSLCNSVLPVCVAQRCRRWLGRGGFHHVPHIAHQEDHETVRLVFLPRAPKRESCAQVT